MPPEVLRGLERAVRAAAASPVRDEGGRRWWVAALEAAARVALGGAVDPNVLVELARDLDPDVEGSDGWPEADAIAALDGSGPAPGRSLLLLALLTRRGRVAVPGGPAGFAARARP